MTLPYKETIGYKPDMILLVDIDHTIRDAAWRDDMITQGDWDRYHLAGWEDKPIQEMIELINGMADSGALIVGCTAIPNKWRIQTTNWMIKYSVNMDEILMRHDNNYRPSGDMKVELIKERFGKDLEQLKDVHVLFIDDNEKVVEAVRALGITVLQCFAAKYRR